MRNFGLIGAAGYIAPRHMKAIAETGGRLVAAVDRHDSVGALDQHSPEARFFTEIEAFERFLRDGQRAGGDAAVDFVSVCSPNYLHDAHCALSLAAGADVICEKPLAIDPARLDVLAALEAEHGKKVYTILQLRLLASLRELRARLQSDPGRKKADVVLSYITRRGPWYHASWKGDPVRSGGVAMNIGIHFFDLLQWLFGPVAQSDLHLSQPDKMAGLLDLQWARVRWHLSLDRDDLPEGYLAQGKPAYRSLTMDGNELEFTGFTELHTESYRDILAGGGFGIEDARPSVELVHALNHAEVVARPDELHPALQKTRR